MGTSSRVSFDAAACLPSRYPACECGLCGPACPVAAIAMADGVPELVADCIGCGACAAACPTGALQTEGFGLPTFGVGTPSEIYIDCWRVPLADSPRGALRVPCFGGINVGWLLAVFDLSGERRIRLLRRGACEGCSAGGAIRSASDALEEAAELLIACDVLPAAVPRFVERPLSSPLAPSIPEAGAAVAIDRRRFFRGLLGGAARAAEDVQRAAAPAGPVRLRQLAQPVARMRTVAALTRIAARRSKVVPAVAVPQLSVGDCDASGTCAAVCPTGALQRVESAGGESAELRFHGTLCVACGECATACPTRALRVSPVGGRPEVDVLARWTGKSCGECGELFFGPGGDACPGCIKRKNLQHGLAALSWPPA